MFGPFQSKQFGGCNKCVILVQKEKYKAWREKSPSDEQEAFHKLQQQDRGGVGHGQTSSCLIAVS